MLCVAVCLLIVFVCLLCYVFVDLAVDVCFGGCLSVVFGPVVC